MILHNYFADIRLSNTVDAENSSGSSGDTDIGDTAGSGGTTDIGDTADSSGTTDIGDTAGSGGTTGIGDTAGGGGTTDIGDTAGGGGTTDIGGTAGSGGIANNNTGNGGITNGNSGSSSGDSNPGFYGDAGGGEGVDDRTSKPIGIVRKENYSVGAEDNTQTEPITTEETIVETTIEVMKETTVATTESVTFLLETKANQESPATSDSPIAGCLFLLLGIIIGIALMVIRNFIRKFQNKNKNKAKRKNTTYTEISGDTIPVAATSVSDPILTSVFQHIGSRNDQQDSYGMTEPALYHDQGFLAVVADGMGGLENGKTVSSTLISTFLSCYEEVKNQSKPQDQLLNLTTRANYLINERFGGNKRSGSTLVSAMIQEGSLYFLSVGDSRIYLYRGGALLQLNREHIYQEELAVKAVNRTVPISQISLDRQAHALTSFLGIGTIPHIDRNYEGISLQKGDRLLLCSDGVYGTLSQKQMEQALQSSVLDAAGVMQDMILKAQKPYQDNFTGIILEYPG